jgi:hypothetical protein
MILDTACLATINLSLWDKTVRPSKFGEKMLGRRLTDANRCLVHQTGA